MTKTIRKNLKIAFISILAVLLFALVNFSVYDNANADDSNMASTNSKNDLYGKKISKESDSEFDYQFTAGGTIGEAGALGMYYLNNKNDNATKHDSEGYEEDYYDFTYIGKALSWGNTKKHPWAAYNLYFGGNDTKAKRNYQFKNLRFIYAEHLESDWQKIGDNCFGVKYDLKTPISWTGDETQRFKITFGMHYVKDGKQMNPTTWDTFTDGFDKGDNCEVLERAGHDYGYGYTFEQAAKDVGCDTFYDALSKGLIEVTVDKIECDQDTGK